MDDFVSAQSFSDFETIQFAYGFIEGDALDWYCDELSRSVFTSWDDLKSRLLHRFGKSIDDVKKQEEPSFMDRMKQLNRVLDRLEQRFKEEDEAKKQKEEARLALVSYSNPIASHVGGSLMSIDPVLEPIQSVILPEVSYHVTEVEVCEKVTEEEDPIVSLRNMCLEKQSGEPKEKDDAGDAPVCQLFDEMSFRGNHVHQVFDQMTVTRKGTSKKKKRWKASLEIQRSREKDLSSEELLGSVGTWSRHTHRQEGVRVRYACQMFDKMHMRRKWVTKKTIPKSKGRKWKYKVEKVNSEALGMQIENMIKGQRKSLRKWWKRVGCQWWYYQPLLNKWWLLRFRKKGSVLNKMYGLGFTKKKKKKTRLQRHERKDIKFKSIMNGKTSERMRKTKMGYEMKRIKHELEFAKLLRGYMTALKKLVKWRKGKFKQKHNKKREKIKVMVLNGGRKSKNLKMSLVNGCS